MFRRIVVPVDGSAFAESAISTALAIAAKTDGEVRLAMVNEPVNLPPGTWAEAFLENHARYLETAVAKVEDGAAEGVQVSSVLLEGEVSRALVAEAEAWEADLVVMSTHGHGGLARIWLGSVTDEVVRASPAPVLLVRPPEDGRDLPVAPAGFRHVVITLDGTPFAEQAIEPALALGRLFGASFTLLRTVPYPVMVSAYLPDTVEQNETFFLQAEELARTYLEEVRGGLGDPSIGTAVIVGPTPARGVLDHVAEHDADLIAMASHGRHGLARAALGSITDKVVRGAGATVLVVHPVKDAPGDRS